MESTLDGGDTTWILISAALVMIMTPGVGFFYAGRGAQKRNLTVTTTHGM